MKIFHIADLHIGKQIYGVSMINQEDQPYWCDQFIQLCEKEKPDVVVIAGDVYDRSAPSTEAVRLLDDFLTRLAQLNILTLLVAGNHDSGQRLSFGKAMLSKSNIYIGGVIEREIEHVTVQDAYGPVTFWLLPYIFPEQIRVTLENDTIHGYDEAMRALLQAQEIDFTQRNVLIAHQNVVANGTEVERGGSETMIGGVGEIEYTAFDGFDYVALGHIHSGYSVGRETVRYAGTPLCYHFDETRQAHKGALMIELADKNTPVQITSMDIEPLHKMRRIKGTREEVDSILASEKTNNQYIGIVLTDQRVTPELSAHYRELMESRDSILMELVSEYRAFGVSSASATSQDVKEKPIEDLFSDLYGEQCDSKPPTDLEYDLMQYAAELIRHMDTHEALDEKSVDSLLNYARKAGDEK